MSAKHTVLLAFSCTALVMSAACSADNNLVFGQVEATVGTHPVVVTDCYRTSVPPPYNSGDVYHFTPCRDENVWMDNETLSVNGRACGTLAGETILADHRVVSVKHPK